jgi:hypothetical protein
MSALSRHRDGVQLHYGRDDFADQRQLVRTLSRERAKDMASDYPMYRDRDAEVRDFADRRGLSGEIRLPDAPERQGVEIFAPRRGYSRDVRRIHGRSAAAIRRRRPRVSVSRGAACSTDSSRSRSSDPRRGVSRARNPSAACSTG